MEYCGGGSLQDIYHGMLNLLRHVFSHFILNNNELPFSLNHLGLPQPSC